jgi:hypothetical protein
MGENKKKIKKKELLRRIQDLEFKLSALRDKVVGLSSPPQALINPDTLLTQPLIKCSQCGAQPGGTCMSVICPNVLKITY